MGERRLARKRPALGPSRDTPGKVPRRAEPRRHLHSRALAGAARRAHADGRALRARGDPGPAGFAYLEVSGGGVFDAAVRRGVESPWERIRALKARTKTPLALAVRGRFLVGSRPVAGDFARRFVACAAESGIDVFRLHDPLNDVENLREAAEAIVDAGREFDAGLLYGSDRHEALVEAARRLPELGAARILLHDPAGAAAAASCGRARRGAARGVGPARRPLLPGRGRERACGGARGRAGRRRPDRLRGLPGRARRCTVCRPRPPRRRSQGSASTRASTSRRSGGPRISSTSTSATRRSPPVVPRIAVRAAQRKIRSGSSPRSTTSCARSGAGDRLDEVLDEIERVRAEAARRRSRRRSGRSSRRRRSSTCSARTATGRSSTSCAISSAAASARRPAPIDPALARAVELLGDERRDERRSTSTRSARRRRVSPRARRSCCCSRSSARRPSRCCERSASARRRGDARGGAASTGTRAERIREVVRIVQETGIDEITVEEEGMRVSVRRTPEPRRSRRAAAAGRRRRRAGRRPPPRDGLVRVESPMVGTFYRAPQPGRAAVRRGGRRRSRRARRSASSRR